MTGLDPRLNAYRDDLAATALEGQVDAPKFVAGERRQVIEAVAPIRARPRHDARLDTEVLMGETLTVFHEIEGWSWVQLARDGYVGYAPSDALLAHILPATHRVTVLGTHLYSGPDIKVPPLARLDLGAEVAVRETQGRFARLEDGRFIVRHHIAPLGHIEPDFVAVAERFLGTPYLWGGRTSLGIDCSGLIQIALEAAGRSAPRDSDMQEAALGEALADPNDRSGLLRGDLVFWPGHVGIMADPACLIHASSHQMQTIAEPLAEANERIAQIRGAVTTIKRLGCQMGDA